MLVAEVEGDVVGNLACIRCRGRRAGGMRVPSAWRYATTGRVHDRAACVGGEQAPRGQRIGSAQQA
jgi:hypothetical protein